MRRGSLLRLLMTAALAVLICCALSSCAPSLTLNPKYSYTHLEFDLGAEIPSDIEEFIILNGVSEKDAEYIRANTEIMYDGAPASEAGTGDAGEHTLTINYRGRKYREYDVLVVDKVPPVFTKSKDLYTFVSIPLSKDEMKGMFAAEDNSGKVKLKVNTKKVDFSRSGKYKVTATATDKSGNKTKSEAYVIVQDPSYGAMGTYVFVSITSQHLTYFVNGETVMDCPVVTGNPYNGHSTPRGTFSILYKSRNITLRGTEDNGDEYESFVNYWMAFIGTSYGLHDASWRSSFGGNIYQGGGSHGCVNMPYNGAARLYELVEPGTPVLVY